MNDAVIAQVLETLNRIERKVDKNHQDSSLALKNHMADESKEIAYLNTVLMGHANTLNAYLEKANNIETAFLRTHDNLPDFRGHHYDHHTRKKLLDWLSAARSDALKHVIELALITFMIWLGYTLWKVFLRGPGD